MKGVMGFRSTNIGDNELIVFSIYAVITIQITRQGGPDYLDGPYIAGGYPVSVSMLRASHTTLIRGVLGSAAVEAFWDSIDRRATRQE
jgi:hypothetical protein